MGQYREISQEVVPVESLPRTFQDAIDFARRLSSDIWYLWSDSLCILQDDKDDWDREFIQMHEVYRNSYCKLSATAVIDSDQGMYADRAKHKLWENEVNLNIDGLREVRDTNAG